MSHDFDETLLPLDPAPVYQFHASDGHTILSRAPSNVSPVTTSIYTSFPPAWDPQPEFPPSYSVACTPSAADFSFSSRPSRESQCPLLHVSSPHVRTVPYQFTPQSHLPNSTSAGITPVRTHSPGRSAGRWSNFAASRQLRAVAARRAHHALYAQEACQSIHNLHYHQRCHKQSHSSLPRFKDCARRTRNRYHAPVYYSPATSLSSSPSPTSSLSLLTPSTTLSQFATVTSDESCSSPSFTHGAVTSGCQVHDNNSLEKFAVTVNMIPRSYQDVRMSLRRFERRPSSTTLGHHSHFSPSAPLVQPRLRPYASSPRLTDCPTSPTNKPLSENFKKFSLKYLDDWLQRKHLLSRLHREITSLKPFITRLAHKCKH